MATTTGIIAPQPRHPIHHLAPPNAEKTTSSSNAAHLHFTQRTPPPPSLTPPTPLNSCTHYLQLSLPLLHERFRSFVAPLASTLPCHVCKRVMPRADLWICLDCPQGAALRCGRPAPSSAVPPCSIEHARQSQHGLIMSLAERVIYCYRCESELYDELPVTSPSVKKTRLSNSSSSSSSSPSSSPPTPPVAILPQQIRRCIDLDKDEPDERYASENDIESSSPRRRSSSASSSSSSAYQTPRKKSAASTGKSQHDEQGQVQWGQQNGKHDERADSHASNNGWQSAEEQVDDADDEYKDSNQDDELMIVEDEEEKDWYYFYTNPRGGLLGLANFGNTCFMNASLQPLLHCPPLIAYLSERLLPPCDDKLKHHLMTDLSLLFRKSWSSAPSSSTNPLILMPTSFTPSDLYRDLWSINPYFRGHGQHDAQELIRILLDALHEGFNKTPQYDFLHYQYDPNLGNGEQQWRMWQAKQQDAEAARKRKEAEEQEDLDYEHGSAGQEGQQKKRKKKKKKINPAKNSRSSPEPTSASTSNLATLSSSPIVPATVVTTSASSPPPSPISRSNSATPSLSSVASPGTSAPATTTSPRVPIKIWPDHSIISDTFAGHLESRIRCHQCNTISTVFDQFYDLSLEIPKEANFKRIAAERGNDALTASSTSSANSSSSAKSQWWLTSLLNWTGITTPPLSLETCLVSGTPVLMRSGLARPIELIEEQQSIASMRQIRRIEHVHHHRKSSLSCSSLHSSASEFEIQYPFSNASEVSSNLIDFDFVSSECTEVDVEESEAEEAEAVAEEILSERLISAQVARGPLLENTRFASNCLQIVTCTGRTVRCTDNHRMAIRERLDSRQSASCQSTRCSSPVSSSSTSSSFADSHVSTSSSRISNHPPSSSFDFSSNPLSPPRSTRAHEFIEARSLRTMRSFTPPSFLAFNACDFLVASATGTVDDRRADGERDLVWRLDFAAFSTPSSASWTFSSPSPLANNALLLESLSFIGSQRDRALAFARLFGYTCGSTDVSLPNESGSRSLLPDSVELHSLLDVQEWQRDVVLVCGVESPTIPACGQEQSSCTEKDEQLQHNSLHCMFLPTILMQAFISILSLPSSSSSSSSSYNPAPSVLVRLAPLLLSPSTPRAFIREFLAAFAACRAVPIAVSLAPTVQRNEDGFVADARLSSLVGLQFGSEDDAQVFGSACEILSLSIVTTVSTNSTIASSTSASLITHVDCRQFLSHLSFRFHANQQLKLSVACEMFSWLSITKDADALIAGTWPSSSSLSHPLNKACPSASSSEVRAFLTLISLPQTLFNAAASPVISVAASSMPVFYLPVDRVEPIDGEHRVHDLSMSSPSCSNELSFHDSVAATPSSASVTAASSAYHVHNFVANGLIVHNCLHSFCTSDRLIASDQYRCDTCKEKVDASKSLALASLPPVLMVHLKRFSHNGAKLTRPVSFPLQGLDMRPFLSQGAREKEDAAAAAASTCVSAAAAASGNMATPSSPSPNTLYNLFGIIRHLGGATGGHYISYCLNHVTNKWYEFDDRNVREISEARLLEFEAYMLFYRRQCESKPLQTLEDRIRQASIMPALHSLTLNGSSNVSSALTSTLSSSTLWNSSASSPSSPVRYLSREYLKRLTVFGSVTPIDNRDLLCSHGVPYELPADGGSLAMPLSIAGWNNLISLYGGGPVVDGQHYECMPCRLPIIRERERKRISHLDAEATQNAKANDPFFLIHDSWLREWRDFMGGANVRPGPISNHLLLDTAGKPIAGLQKVRDYRGLHGSVWNELLRLYGGGPSIVRAQLDIYSPATTLLTSHSSSQ